MSDARIFRVDQQSFADDSFKTDSSGLVVVGQLATWSELSWHADLVRVCGPDLKWSKVRHHWPDLSSDLKKSILRDIRDALVTIIDPSPYRFELNEALAEVVGTQQSRWPPGFQAWAAKYGDKYEMQRVLVDSPAFRIQNFLEDDGGVLSDDLLIGGIPENTDESRSILSDLQERLKSPHTVRLFGARSAAAFPELVDREEWAKALAVLHDMRYVTPRQMFAHLFAHGERTQRVFDEGNQPSVRAISDLKDSVRQRLSNSGHIILTDDLPRGAIEESSTDSPMLQAADLVAGYARSLYLESGLRVVCEEFKGVIFNGGMVRDWLQLQGHDTDLRTRK